MMAFELEAEVGAPWERSSGRGGRGMGGAGLGRKEVSLPILLMIYILGV